jgi:outer membrane receptor for Fe3+-dicitrate
MTLWIQRLFDFSDFHDFNSLATTSEFDYNELIPCLNFTFHSNFNFQFYPNFDFNFDIDFDFNFVFASILIRI